MKYDRTANHSSDNNIGLAGKLCGLCWSEVAMRGGRLEPGLEVIRHATASAARRAVSPRARATH